MEYVLTTDHLCKNYGHFKALNQCSMHVPRGAIYGFVGKNGAGKTTLRTARTDIRKLQVIWKRKYGQENFGSAEKNRRSCGDPVDLSGYDGGRKHERAVLCFGLAVF